MDIDEFGEWCQDRMNDFMDGLLVFFGLGACAFQAALIAGLVWLPLGFGWELLNPDQSGEGSDQPLVTTVVVACVFAFTLIATAGRAFREFEGIKRN
jgi:hypothetical protein